MPRCLQREQGVGGSYPRPAAGPVGARQRKTPGKRGLERTRTTPKGLGRSKKSVHLCLGASQLFDRGHLWPSRRRASPGVTGLRQRNAGRYFFPARYRGQQPLDGFVRILVPGFTQYFQPSFLHDRVAVCRLSCLPNGCVVVTGGAEVGQRTGCDRTRPLPALAFGPKRQNEHLAVASQPEFLVLPHVVLALSNTAGRGESMGGCLREPYRVKPPCGGMSYDRCAPTREVNDV